MAETQQERASVQVVASTPNERPLAAKAIRPVTTPLPLVPVSANASASGHDVVSAQVPVVPATSAADPSRTLLSPPGGAAPRFLSPGGAAHPVWPRPAPGQSYHRLWSVHRPLLSHCSSRLSRVHSSALDLRHAAVLLILSCWSTRPVSTCSWTICEI